MVDQSSDYKVHTVRQLQTVLQHHVNVRELCLINLKSERGIYLPRSFWNCKRITRLILENISIQRWMMKKIREDCPDLISITLKQINLIGRSLEELGTNLRELVIEQSVSKAIVHQAFQALYDKGVPLEVVILSKLEESPQEAFVLKFLMENFTTLKTLKANCFRENIGPLTRFAAIGLNELVINDIYYTTRINDTIFIQNDIHGQEIVWKDIETHLFSQKLTELRKLDIQHFKGFADPKMIAENCPSLEEIRLRVRIPNLAKYFLFLPYLRKLDIVTIDLAPAELLEIMTSFQGEYLSVVLMSDRFDYMDAITYPEDESRWITNEMLNFLRNHNIVNKRKIFKMPFDYQILSRNVTEFERFNIDLMDVIKFNDLSIFRTL